MRPKSILVRSSRKSRDPYPSSDSLPVTLFLFASRNSVLRNRKLELVCSDLTDFDFDSYVIIKAIVGCIGVLLELNFEFVPCKIRTVKLMYFA